MNRIGRWLNYYGLNVRREWRRSMKHRAGRANVRGRKPGIPDLTPEEVADIRTLAMGNREAAELYGLSRRHVWNIRNGRTWSSLRNYSEGLL